MPWIVVLLSVLPLVGSAVLMSSLSSASNLAASVWQRGDAAGNWLNFGGNPSEVYSHWLDWVALSGNAITLSWLLVLDWIATQRCGASMIGRFMVGMLPVSAVVLCWAWAAVLDRRYGEGPTLFWIGAFFAPVLAASFLLLRGLALHLRRLRTVLLVAASFALLHATCQWFYEPSSTGGPNALILPAGAVLMLAFAFERLLLDRGQSNSAPGDTSSPLSQSTNYPGPSTTNP